MSSQLWLVQTILNSLSKDLAVGDTAIRADITGGSSVGGPGSLSSHRRISNCRVLMDMHVVQGVGDTITVAALLLLLAHHPTGIAVVHVETILDVVVGI